MLYQKTKDILYVKEKLGHRNINSTLIYTQLVSFDKGGYASKKAKTTKEACQLVEAGFEHACTTPQNVMLLRKRK
jgi:oxalate decarboxylase/phosphoglucose isomerase-like protein (cupin superfamily)